MKFTDDKMKELKILKGKLYEKFVGEYFKKEGYIIVPNGILEGKKDSGIDIIAVKHNEVIFMQCKNWAYNPNYQISREKIQAFIGATYVYMEENKPTYDNYEIKRYFVVANKVLDESAAAYCEDKKNIIKYVRIPVNKLSISSLAKKYDKPRIEIMMLLFEQGFIDIISDSFTNRDSLTAAVDSEIILTKKGELFGEYRFNTKTGDDFPCFDEYIELL